MTDRILVIKGIAGLGDRLFSLLVGLLYASLDDRSVCIDWRDEFYGNDTENIFDQLFEIHGIEQVALPKENSEIFPAVWRSNIHTPLPEFLRKEGMLASWNREKIIQNYSVSVVNLGRHEPVCVFCCDNRLNNYREVLAYKFPEWGALTDIQLLQSLVKRHISLKPKLKKAVDIFVCQYFRKPTVGVHIRKTNECGDRAFESKLYHRHIKRIGKQLGEFQVFLATDNEAVQREFKEAYGAKLVCRNKWYSEPGQPLHFSSSACPDKILNLQDAAIEMFLLAKCTHIVIPGNSGFSGFSELASKLSPSQVTKLSSLESQKLSTRLSRFFVKCNSGMASFGNNIRVG